MFAVGVVGIRTPARRTLRNRFRVPDREVHPMRPLPLARHGVFGLAAACLLLPAMAWAQPPVKPAVSQTPPGVHAMEIYNGTMRTVHYFPSSTSPSEVAALRELEQAENEMALSDRLLDLRRQYVSDERLLEARRFSQQMLLYGYSTQTAALAAYGPGVGGYPYGGLYGYAGVGGYPYLGGGVVGGGSSSTASLAYGVGDEGAIKTDIARVLAAQATPDARARATQNLDRALAQAGQFDSLRRDLKIVPVTQRAPEGDVLVLKDGTRVQGKITKEDADWVTMKTGSGDRTWEERVRMSEVVRILKGDASGVKPATNP